jgi:hypothetical protein
MSAAASFHSQEIQVRVRICAAALLAISLLAGCSACPEPSAIETERPNEGACLDFGIVTKLVADRIVEGSDASNAEEFRETMESMKGRFDEAALIGEGEVKERIETLVRNLPDPVLMLIIHSDQYFEDLVAVERACNAEDITVDVYSWS